jgi:putative transposase
MIPAIHANTNAPWPSKWPIRASPTTPTITAVLQASKSFISKWKGIYDEQGVAGFRIGYRGSAGYLTADQRDQTIAWLRAQYTWSVPALQTYLRDTFQVEYQSLQSYYDLLHAAGLSWKKSQATNPKKTMSWSPKAGRK